MESVVHMTKLIKLDLSHTQITDVGLRLITPSTRLEQLSVRNLEITAACMEDLSLFGILIVPDVY